jgi:general secretion pathway protein C
MRWPSASSDAALPVAAAPEALPAVDANVVARLLGTQAVVSVAPPDAASRFRVTGIVAQGAGKGVALVSMDGKPAKPYRVGSQLDTGWVLQSVAARSIALGAELNGPALLQLELPRQP